LKAITNICLNRHKRY